MNARIKPTPSKPTKLVPAPAADDWAALAESRRRAALKIAADAYLAAAAEMQAQTLAYRDHEPDEMETHDHIIQSMSIDTEKALMALILAPQAELAPTLRSELYRVRCHPAAVQIGSTLYAVVPGRNREYDPIGTVCEHSDGSIMAIHAIDLAAVERID